MWIDCLFSLSFFLSPLCLILNKKHPFTWKCTYTKQLKGRVCLRFPLGCPSYIRRLQASGMPNVLVFFLSLVIYVLMFSFSVTVRFLESSLLDRFYISCACMSVYKHFIDFPRKRSQRLLPNKPKQTQCWIKDVKLIV